MATQQDRRPPEMRRQGMDRIDHQNSIYKKECEVEVVAVQFFGDVGIQAVRIGRQIPGR